MAGGEPWRPDLISRVCRAQRPAVGGIPAVLISRFDVYPAPGRGRPGYVLDVQADLLYDIGTRVVVPLLPPSYAPKPAHDLNPAFEIADKPYLMMTQFIAAVPEKELKRSVTSLHGRHNDITRALDILLVGL